MEENELTLIFFDLETTGLNPDTDEVIEIGAIKVMNDKIIGRFTSFVRPNRNIPSLVTNLTGITFGDVENAPPPEETRKKLGKFIGNFPLIAHNVHFDQIFLEKFMDKHLENEFFDTLELSRIFFPKLKSHSLQNLVKTLSLEKEEAHRAISDTLMLYSLFKKIVRKRKTSSPYLLHKVKEISKPIRKYEHIFGNNWEKSDKTEKSFIWKLNNNENEELQPEPSPGDALEIHGDIGKYLNSNSYVQKNINDNFLKEIVNFSLTKKLIVSVYDSYTKQRIIQFAKKYGSNAYLLDKINRFVCPKNIDYILTHLDLLTNNFRMSFATLFSYLYESKDFMLRDAPTYVMKNQLLRLLSFCDTEWTKCNYAKVCPLRSMFENAKKSNIIIINHSFFFSDLKFKFDFSDRDAIFLNAYRLIKTFYSSKVGFSLNDFLFFAKYYKLNDSDTKHIKEVFRIMDEKRIGDDIQWAATEMRMLFGNFNNPILLSFFGKEYFWLERRGGSPFIFASDNRVKSVFNEIKNHLSNVSFIIPKMGIDNHKNVLESFTGIRGDSFTVDNDFNGKVMSVVPLFLHSPNREEFITEFVRFFDRVHKKGNKAVMFFSSNETRKRVYFLLRRNGENVKARGIDLKDDIGEVELYLYDISLAEINADEIFFVRLPNLSSVNYNKELFNVYAAFILKNISYDLVRDKDKGVVFYFDGRFKTPSFRSKFTDIFVSFPLFIDREESLITILSNRENTNT